MADAVFKQMEEGLRAQGAALVKKVNAVYEWKVGDQSWTMDVKTGPTGTITKGAPATKADCTLTLKKESDFLDLVSGKSNAQQAFMQGKLKIGGGMNHAMKLGSIISKPGASL